MNVPFVDLRRQYERIKDEIDKSIEEVLASTAFIQGKAVFDFEDQFSKYCGSKHCVAVNSGTSALMIALMANGIGVDDEVITATNSFIATAEAISLVGAKPVFVDVDSDSFNIDVSKIEEVITDKTKAIIPVHLYGQPADLDEIRRIAKEKGLIVIEDACQAHGAFYKDKRIGSMGNTCCFSFYPGKNLGAFGEGGALVTDDEEIAYRARSIRDHGTQKKYYHEMVGMNARMEGIQGAVLGVKLKYLDEWNEGRIRNAKKYDDHLMVLEDIKIPEIGFDGNSVYHLYVIRNERRDDLLEYLSKFDIATGIHYPIPIHLQKAYEFLDLKKGSFPVSEKLAEEILSLPMFPDLTSDEIEYVCEKILEFAKK